MRMKGQRSPAPPSIERPLGEGQLTPPSDYLSWLTTLYPETYTKPLAAYHHEFWKWIWARTPEQSATGVFIWPRGFSKTTNAERAVVKFAAAGFRYILYVKGTQEASDDAVQNIEAILGGEQVAAHYPLLADRAVNKYGASKGWRRNRLRTAAGVIVDAAGLDTKIRGLLIEGQRPDVIVIDDVDDTADTEEATKKKLRKIKSDIIPAGAPNRVILAVQNLINPHGIFTRLAGVNPDLQADFLLEREVSGPHPAVRGLEYALQAQPDGRRVYKITAGVSTWPEGRPIPLLESEMNEIGADTFVEEKQHEVMQAKGSLYEGFDLPSLLLPYPDLAVFEDIHVWVDPAVTDKDSSDSNGIRAGGRVGETGLGGLRTGLVIGLYSWEGRDSVDSMMRRAIQKAVELKASTLGIETNQGGDTWEVVYDATWDKLTGEGAFPPSTPKPRFVQAKATTATGGKRERWQIARAARQRGEYLEAIGTHGGLFKALGRLPEKKPYDLADVDYWLWDALNATDQLPPSGIAGYEQDNSFGGDDW